MEKTEKIKKIEEEFPPIEVMFKTLAAQFRFNEIGNRSEEDTEMQRKLIKAREEAQKGNSEEIKRLFNKYVRKITEEELRKRFYNSSGFGHQIEEFPPPKIDIRV